MLKFLRKFLQAKEEEAEPEPLKLSLAEAPDFLNKQRAGREGEATQVIKDALAAVESLSKEAEDAMQALEEAKLRNENIPPKAMQYMKGNRESFIRMTQAFLRDAVPSSAITESARALHGINTFKEQLSQYHDSTLRNYQVLQQFFAHESHAVAQKVKQIDEQLRGLEGRLDELGLRKLSELEDQATHLLNVKKRREELEQELKEAERQHESAKEAKRKASEALGEFLKTKEYFAFEQKKKDRKAEEEALQQHEAEFRLAFSSLEKPLKKLAKVSIENEEQITEYVYRPEEALARDSQFGILSILSKLRDAIQSGSVSLEDKKKEKALDCISSLDKAYLEEYQRKAKELSAKISSLQSEIEKDPVQEQHNELSEHVARKTDAIRKAERQVAQAQESLGNITLDKDMEGLAEGVTSVTGRPTTITLEKETAPKRAEESEEKKAAD